MTVISLYKPGFCGYLYFFWLGTSVECLGHVTGSCLTPSSTAALFPKVISVCFPSLCIRALSLTATSYHGVVLFVDVEQPVLLRLASASWARGEEERHARHALALPDYVAVLFLKDILVDILAVDFFCSCFGLFETGPCSVAQGDLGHVMLLPQPLEC